MDNKNISAVKKLAVFVSAMMLVIVYLSSPLFSSVSNAATVDELKKQQQQINQQKADIEKKNAEMQGSITQTQQDYDQEWLKYLSNQEQLNQFRLDIAGYNEELATAESNYQDKEKQLQDRLVYMYQQEGNQYIDAIIGSKNLSDALEKTYYLSLIVDNTNQLMNEIKGLKGDIEEKKSLVVNQQYDLQTTTATQETNIQNLKDINQSMTQQITANTSKEESLTQQYAKLQEDIAKEISRQQIVNTPYSGGTMGWPVPSSHRVSSPFGGRVNPISGRSEMHTGIDIPAPGGTPINASASGKVIYAQWNSGGYGNMIAIDHGGGIATYYCHCSSISVNVGQTVSRGQLIGRVGSTGYSTGNHLHFEVRVNGVARNPLSYVS